jgi:glutaconate CoA-transferase subunit B
VEQVDFVTTKGNIDRIITPLAVFKYQDGRLQLESISPLTSIEKVVRQTGFEINTDHITVLPLPTSEEMRIIQQIDKKGVRYKEF